MKIALAYNVFDSVSGETVFFENMLQGLEGRGFDIVRCPIHQAPPNTVLGFGDHIVRFPFLLNARSAIARLGGCDILHCMNSAIAPVASVFKGKKIATSNFFIDSYLSLCPNPNPVMAATEGLFRAYLAMMDAPAFRSMDRLVVLSAFHANDISKSYGIPLQKMPIISPGVDTGYFRSLPKTDLRSEYGFERVVACMGRLHERFKGFSYAIRAMKDLDKETGLLIVGDGPDRKAYEALVRSEHLEDRVKLLGRLDFRTKSMIQKSADAVAMPSLYEAFGTVFAESLACGTPVAAFDLPFWKGLYDGAGVFAKPRDAGSLSHAIKKALEGGDEVRKAKERGTALAGRYDMENTISSYIRLYESLLEGG
ncbi:MAG: glycosyltransferase family 4 protein [Candidatus Micrarchaeota archaeon]